MATLQSILKLTLLDGVTGPARRINGALSDFQRRQTAMLAPFRGIGAQLLAFGGAYLGVTKGLSSTVGAAIEFESAFADVKKVVEASDEQFENMARTIKSMSRELPMTSSEIAQLFAAAGESGVATEDLKSFAEMAARVGIAFDMSAGEAGESLAKLKAQLGLTVAETGEMADAINHLSNNMASKAKDITAYMLRVGKFAEMGGFAKEQVAAIGSAMISAGAEAETAGTAMMNVVRKMTAGGFAKKDQREAAKALGLDLPTLAKQMKKDAPKALKSVLKALAKAPEEQRIALLSKFFGDEARAFAPLVGNLGLLDEALDGVADRTQYSGSAFREYVARANTTANALQILRNKVSYFFEDIGQAWLPTIKDAVAELGAVLDTLGSRASVFDDIKYALKGFTQGLGYDGGIREVIRDLGDLLFGKEDPSGSADRLGRVFAKFKEWGASVRELSDAIRNNPIAQFFGELAGHGFKLVLAAGAISILAGTIMKLGRALAFLTGITTAIGIIKTLGKMGGIIGGAAAFPGLGDKPPKGGGPNTPSVVPWWSRAATWAKGLGLNAIIGAIPQILSDTPGDTFEDQVKNQGKAKDGLRKLFGLNPDENGVPGWKRFLLGDAAKPGFNSKQHFGVETKASSVSLDTGTIGQLLQPSKGTQDVRVTNKEPPQINLSVVQNITGVSSPQEAADRAASLLGQAAKAAYEAADTD